MVWRADPIDFSKEVDLRAMKGRSVLVTGGADGIGFGIAKEMAEAGAYVTIADRNEGLGRQREEEALRAGRHIRFVEADVTSWESLTEAFKTAIGYSPHKSLDIVVANAGLRNASIVPDAFPEDLPEGADLPAPPLDLFQVSLIGPYYTTVLALHYFKKTHKPEDTFKKHLLLVGSVAGYIELPLCASYNAVKFGVRGMWKSIRYQEEEFGFPFRTNLVTPFFARTALTAPYVEEVAGQGIRVARIEDIATGVMRVACDEEINGRSICFVGEKTFDLGDDPAGQDGFKAWWNAAQSDEIIGPGGKVYVRTDEFFR